MGRLRRESQINQESLMLAFKSSEVMIKFKRGHRAETEEEKMVTGIEEVKEPRGQVLNGSFG